MNIRLLIPFRAWAVAAIALLIALLMLPNLVWLVHSHAVTTWVAALVLPLALLLALFALLGRWPWLACLLLAPFALLAPIESFYVARYHTPSTATVIATLFSTNPLETREYLGRLLVVAIAVPLAALALALVASWLSARARLYWDGRSRQWCGALGLAVAIPLVAWSIGSSLHQRPTPNIDIPQVPGSGINLVAPGFPFGELVRFTRYAEQWTSMRAFARRSNRFDFHARRTGPALHQRQVYVLVIGESSARDRWQLFGYDRPTNPELSKLADLVPIRRMVTSWPETIAAVPLMVTRKPIVSTEAGWHEPSFLRAMQEAGYETWWISNQYPIGEYDSPVAMYAYEAQHVVWVNHSAATDNPNAYDENLITPLRRALDDSSHDLFIVLHMMGSHEYYDYRYPPRFRRFTPVESDRHSSVPRGIRIGNSYDNTIVYTDHILAQVIDLLKRSGAVTALWYESDHGEVLPSATCHKFGHAFGTWHEFEIPALFWYSKPYARHFPQHVATLRANADKRTLSADTFASLIDMAGVTFPSHDETRSLFSPRWRYRKRIVAQWRYFDFDHASFGGACGVIEPGLASNRH